LISSKIIFSFFVIFLSIITTQGEAKTTQDSKVLDLNKEVTFIIEKEKHKYSLDKMLKEKNIKKSAMTSLEPHQNFKKIIYDGFDTRSLLTFIFGDKWKDSELVLFKCADGYQDPVPTENIKTFNSLLAFRIEPVTKNASPTPFSLVNQGQHENIDDLGPLYLVWDNITNKDLKAEGSTHWPYQVVEIQLAQFIDKFPKMIPKSTDPVVLNGLKNFQKHCMSCHQINGQGGVKGPDLNRPTNIFSSINEASVRTKIDNPQALNPQTTMPPLNLSLIDRKKVIDEIITYLHAMKN
jgi:hypothetical protein